MFKVTSALSLLSLASLVTANSNFGLSIGINTNWGCSPDKAPAPVRNQCSGAGSFFTIFGGSAICCSASTRISVPSNIICPLEWFFHKTEKCCIPEKEVSPCDCGEGYSWNSQTLKCTPNNSNKCSKSQWFHERSSSCCDNSWGSSPPVGTCPSGISCPTDWFWHKDLKVCRPHHPRSPEPDCNNWDNHNQCCGSGSSPSQGAGRGPHGKRNQKARTQLAFPQSDIDAMYCPGNLHACSTTNSGEWSYECIDFATELESCGGCASSGEGQDCTTIPHAMSMGCNNGVCEVYTCQSGYQANGTSCVAN